MLAILASHPIQYQVPLWRELTRRAPVPVEVWYLTDQGHRVSYDPGFDRSFAWDVDLMSGYNHRLLATHPAPPDLGRFRGARLSSFGSQLRDHGAVAVLLNGWYPQAFWQAAWQARACGIPVLLRGESNDLARPSWWKRSARRLALARLFDRVSMFLAVGTANRRLYESFGVSQARIRMSPYCVDNARFSEAADAWRRQRPMLRQKWRVPHDAVCLLFCGKLIAKKRVADLLSGFERLLAARQSSGTGPPVHLLIAGDGALRGLVDARVPELRGAGGRAAVSSIGFLNQSEMPQAYAAADCLVLPSDATETWGLVVNEAMACGLPAIVSDEVGCGPDLIEPDKTGAIFPMGNVERLAEAMTAWADADRCMAARPHVLSRIGEYSLERAADGILAGLQTVSGASIEARVPART